MVVVALVDPDLLSHHLDLGVVAVGDVDGGLDSAKGDSAVFDVEEVSGLNVSLKLYCTIFKFL